jgi:thiamine biosynthesis lipoprotein
MVAAVADRVLIPPALSARLLTEPTQGSVHTLSGTTMGTVWQVRVVAAALAPALRADIDAVFARVIAQMSTWEPTSDISRFNQAAADSWFTLSDDFHTVLASALQVAQASGGAYDPTVGALVDLWGFGPGGARPVPPDPSELNRLHSCSGWHRLSLDSAEQRIRQPGDLFLDLSSIAKGYAVDQIAALLEQQGLRHYLVEIGGELRGAGCKPDGMPWWVEVEVGDQSQSSRTLLALHDCAVATSGDYRRYREADGRRYSHTIDPRTGFPIESDLASVTVLGVDCMHADAWATALHVLGLHAGLALAESHHLAALLVKRTASGFEEHCTSALEPWLQ